MLLNINKPQKITSHDVVNEVRKITKEQRVGHAGTLDPFATGVLVVAVGRNDTKKLGALTKDTDKEYIATLELGKTSTTGDPEGIITPAKHSFRYPHRNHIKDVLKSFTGTIQQIPPAYSAIKIKGVPAYKLARKGKEVKLSPRTVEIKELKLLSFGQPLLEIKVVCSAGTYIRSLAKDIGEKLGTGAYLTKLQRTRVGTFKIEDSIPLLKLNQIQFPATTKRHLPY
jgi:tRNA pseudouridine55 synthase